MIGHIIGCRCCLRSVPMLVKHAREKMNEEFGCYVVNGNEMREKGIRKNIFRRIEALTHLACCLINHRSGLAQSVMLELVCNILNVTKRICPIVDSAAHKSSGIT